MTSPTSTGSEANAKHIVLIVEDEADLRELMRDALELQGYAVVTATDGQDALQQLSHIPPPCLILLDLMMPRMNGWEFFEKLQSRPELTTVPVIVHSSSPAQAPRGVAQALQKPLAFERLLSVVSEYCDWPNRSDLPKHSDSSKYSNLPN